MEEIEKFLKEINCENILKDHEFDEESILLIEEKDLAELFPKIGPRIKFKNFLKKIKNDLPITYVDDYTVHALPSSEPSPRPSPIPSSESELTHPISSPIPSSESELTQPISSSSSSKETNAASLDGRAILREGHIAAGLLKEGSRRKLSQLVILNKLEQNPSKTITTQEFYRLATDICELFAKESVVVYYSAYESSAKGTAKKNASGKLYESYISRRRKLREEGYLPGTSRLSSKSSGSSTNSPVALSEDAEENLHDESLQWLHHNVDPWQEVEEKWRETTELRLKQINKGEGQIDDYFKEFPALQNPAGYTLLLQDFRHMYPEAENKFFSKITLKKDDIIRYAKSKLANTRDKYVKNAIKDLLLLVDDANPETSTNVAISLLAFVINTSPARKKKNKSIWKPSRAEIYEGFIAQTATEGDFTDYIISKRERMVKLGRTLQPFVAYVGKSVVNINKAYVVINSTVYSFQKLVTAIDCVFKIYQATGAYYPEESEDIWTSIQIGFYEIKT